MILAHGERLLLVPQQFHSAQLAVTLQCLQSGDFVQKLTHILVSRDFAQLWTDPEVLQGLRTQCVHCGGHYQPADLLRHLLTVHPQTCAWAAQIAFQLYDPMLQQQSQDFQCDCCNQIYNLPVAHADTRSTQRELLQKSHFASNCPVALQIATLLHPINGRVDGSERSSADGRPERPGAPAVRQSAASRSSRRRATQQEAQVQGQKRLKLRRTQARGHPHHAPTDGTAATQPRTEPPTQPASGLLRYVLPKSTRGHCAAPHVPGQDMEGGMAETAGQHQMAEPAHLFGAGSHQGASSPSSAALQLQGRGPALGRGNEQRHHPSRWSMGVSEVVAGDQTTSQGGQAAHDHADHAQDTTDAGRSFGQQHARGSVQEFENGPNNDPMAPTVDTQGNRSLGSAGGAMPQHRVVDAGDERQTPQPSPLQAGDAAPEDPRQRGAPEQRQREGIQAFPIGLDAASRRSLRARALQLFLENPRNVCYANSSFLCLVWASLSRRNFQFQDWGLRSTILQQVLQQGDGHMFSLADSEWFSELIEGWIEDGEQADSAEFSHLLSSWMATPAISNCWERRVQMEQDFVRHDSGDQYMPLTLQLDPQMIHHDEVPLATLLRSWSTELGMLAGITDTADLLLLHIDRLVHSPQGALVKCHAEISFGWEVQVPALVNGQCVMIPYTVVACISHQGDAAHGHYQCLLRTYPEVSNLATPTIWMSCDDGRAPVQCLNMPDRFAAGLTCLWLCRTDRVELHRLPRQPATVDEDSAIIALLTTQPDPEP